MGRYKYDRFKGNFSRETINAIIEDLKKSDDICVDDYDWSILDIRVKKANHAQRHRFKDTIEKLKSHINETPFNYVVFSTDDEKDIFHFDSLMNKRWKDDELNIPCYCNGDHYYYSEDVVREFIHNGNVEPFSQISPSITMTGPGNYRITYKQYKNVKGIHLLKVSQFSRLTGRNRKTVEDWARKKLIASTKIGGIRHIKIEETIDNLEKR